MADQKDTRSIYKKYDPFKTSKDSSSWIAGKFIGGNIPLHVAEYLHLLALYSEKSIQGTLQSIIEEWCSEREPISTIIETLADRAHIEWNRRKKERELTKKHEAEYLEEIAQRLRKHKIKEEYVIKIVDALHTRMELTR